MLLFFYLNGDFPPLEIQKPNWLFMYLSSLGNPVNKHTSTRKQSSSSIQQRGVPSNNKTSDYFYDLFSFFFFLLIVVKNLNWKVWTLRNNIGKKHTKIQYYLLEWFFSVSTLWWEYNQKRGVRGFHDFFPGVPTLVLWNCPLKTVFRLNTYTASIYQK